MRTLIINYLPKIFSISVLITLLVFPGYVSSAEINNETSPQFLSANTDFSLKLFKEVSLKNPAQNVLLSPSSLSFALSMAYNGAAGDTRQAIAGTLQFSGLSEDEINNNNATLMNALQKSNPQGELTIANSMWTKKEIKFKPEFLQKNNNFYRAEIAPLESVATINRWVNQKTKGKIAKIIDKISNDAALLLINAVYFKGNWETVFNPKLTRTDSFNLNNGKIKKLPMMTRSGNFKYFQNQNFQAVSLPYRGSTLSLYIFLPTKDDSPKPFIQALNAGTWESYRSSFKDAKGTLTLPRFKLNYDANLNETLKSLGMDIAFDPVKADFSAMTENKNPISINKIMQKTFMEVNETGTEAAAVTSIQFVATSARINEEEPFEMVVDRPFFCAIMDNQTGTILFIGAVNEPEAAG